MVLATTHRAEEVDADLVVEDPSALSALVIDGGGEISVRRRVPGPGCPPLSTMRTTAAGQDRTSGLLIA